MPEVTIANSLPWALSAGTIATNWLAGSKRRSAWVVALANTALWSWFIIHERVWGLLPMNAALWIVYARNWFKWDDKCPKP
jgi:hypothetical protein